MKDYIEALREIKKENKDFKITLSRKEVLELVNEFDRLNNIINELEKELENNYSVWMCKARENGKSVQFGIDVCKTHFYNRLKELKGDSSNDK